MRTGLRRCIHPFGTVHGRVQLDSPRGRQRPDRLDRISNGSSAVRHASPLTGVTTALRPRRAWRTCSVGAATPSPTSSTDEPGTTVTATVATASVGSCNSEEREGSREMGAQLAQLSVPFLNICHTVLRLTLVTRCSRPGFHRRSGPESDERRRPPSVTYRTRFDIAAHPVTVTAEKSTSETPDPRGCSSTRRSPEWPVRGPSTGRSVHPGTRRRVPLPRS